MSGGGRPPGEPAGGGGADTGYDAILYERRGPVAVVTLNRPAVLNALSAGLIRDVHAAFDRLEADDGVRVAVLRGAGRAFSAGYDLKESGADPPRGVLEWRARLERDVRFTLRVWDCPKPVIAAVHGYCLAGACDLAMMCDLTIAAEGTLFGEPEIRFGSGVVTLAMPWVVGMKKTRELLYTGSDRLTAEEALALGLVNRVVPAARLESETLALAEEIARNDPEAVRLTKLALNRTYERMGIKDALAMNLELDTIMEAAETPMRREFNRVRAAEGLRAALAWRDARFRRD
jgi:enoyl-CoA hydratase/carnithine racemase